MKLIWTKDETSGGFSCRIGNVTLFAVPVRTVTRAFKTKAARGTMWRAGCTHWNEATRTASRYGRDAYHEVQFCAGDAQRLAEVIYTSAPDIDPYGFTWENPDGPTAA